LQNSISIANIKANVIAQLIFFLLMRIVAVHGSLVDIAFTSFPE